MTTSNIEESLIEFESNKSIIDEFTYEEKQNYYLVDLTIRIINPKNTYDTIYQTKNNILLPKTLFDSNENKNIEIPTLIKMFQFLDGNVYKTNCEKVTLHAYTDVQLTKAYQYAKINFASDSNKIIDLEKIKNYIRILDPECKNYKDLNKYNLSRISVYDFRHETGRSIDVFKDKSSESEIVQCLNKSCVKRKISLALTAK